ncbi:MAG: hypothetical protein ACI9FG_001410, partial [Crocinitomicaceae bacterium]
MTPDNFFEYERKLIEQIYQQFISQTIYQSDNVIYQ